MIFTSSFCAEQMGKANISRTVTVDKDRRMDRPYLVGVGASASNSGEIVMLPPVTVILRSQGL